MEQYTISLSGYDNEYTFSGGSLNGVTEPVKFLTLPINLNFSDNGYSDLINEIIDSEIGKVTNSISDRETLKFNSAIYNTSQKSNLRIDFYFINTANTFSTSFLNAGFTTDDITNSRNRLTKSFFKLDFYDSNNETERNYLFSEFLSVNLQNTASFSFNRLFWLKNDDKFIKNKTYRTLYFDATFFNAKDGTVRKFINRDIPSTLTLSQYNSNLNWRSAKLKVLNPYTETNNLISNYNKVFYVEPINGNTDSVINFIEIKIV